jgi:transcriptional regulator GlxA family with amidase domain
VATHRIAFVIFPGFQSLDLTGPFEVFAGANSLLASPAYELLVVAAQAGPVRSESGLAAVADHALVDIDPTSVDTVIAVGGLGTRQARHDTLLTDWIGAAAKSEATAEASPSGPVQAADAKPANQATSVSSPTTHAQLGTAARSSRSTDAAQPAGAAWAAAEPLTGTNRSVRVASVCTGTFLLAAAGLLDGLRVTTHWARAEQLAADYPAVIVDADPIFIRSGNVWTSAGVTAGIDLALAMVEEDHGATIAQTVARWLVMFLRRPGGQSQFAAPVWSPSAPLGPIRLAQDHVQADPSADLSVPKLAQVASMSERHFLRVFAREVGCTPADYVERVRLDTARRLLEQRGDGVETIARSAGFGTAETMRRVFIRRLGVSPTDYRRRFTTATTERHSA